jgi:hypothetical protein
MESNIKDPKDRKALEEKWRQKTIIPKNGKVVRRFRIQGPKQHPDTLCCICCGNEIGYTNSVQGRIQTRLLSKDVEPYIKTSYDDSGAITGEALVSKVYFPEFKTGRACLPCKNTREDLELLPDIAWNRQQHIPVHSGPNPNSTKGLVTKRTRRVERIGG